METKEIIICAAVKDKRGRVFRCHRHCGGFREIRDRGLEIDESAEAQGFVTSENRYVNRAEAYAIQIAAGIKSVSPDGYCKGQLYSEDLY